MGRLTVIKSILAIMVCWGWIGIAYALDLTAQEEAWLAAHPVIRVGIDPAWPPYEFVDKQGQYRGISADYMALIANKLGVSLAVTKDQTWTEVKRQLEQKQLDVSPSVAETPKRREFLSFTQAYISFPVVILTRVDEPFIGQLEDLQEQRVGVEKDYFAD
ncbi:MAG: transporter substrate-binding domain-containing protein, partial [Moraxellaceae bacterium]|nr:transporter substrate-binding domain-containing protein [Moraxellaceae bacterium]